MRSRLVHPRNVTKGYLYLKTIGARSRRVRRRVGLYQIGQTCHAGSTACLRTTMHVCQRILVERGIVPKLCSEDEDLRPCGEYTRQEEQRAPYSEV